MNSGGKWTRLVNKKTMCPKMCPAGSLLGNGGIRAKWGQNCVGKHTCLKFFLQKFDFPTQTILKSCPYKSKGGFIIAGGLEAGNLAGRQVLENTPKT